MCAEVVVAADYCWRDLVIVWCPGRIDVKLEIEFFIVEFITGVIDFTEEVVVETLKRFVAMVGGETWGGAKL